MQIITKWMGRFVFILCAALIFLSFAFFLVTGTSSGIRLLADNLGPIIPGEIQLTGIEGGLWGKLHIHNFSYTGEAAEVVIHDGLFEWRPLEFISGACLHVVGLSLKSVSLHLPETGEGPVPSESNGLDLPDITLPFTVKLDALNLDDLEVQRGDDVPFKVLHSGCKAVLDKDGLHLSLLDLELPELKVTARGGVKLAGKYPLMLKTHLTFSDKTMQELAINGLFEGDCEHLAMYLHSDKVLRAEIRGYVEPHPLAFDLKGRWEKISWPIGGPPEFVSENGNMHLSGDMGSYRLDLSTVLQGRDVRASAEVSVDDQAVIVKDFLLTTPKKNLLRVSGAVGESMDLDWFVDIEDLSGLMPEAGGSIRGSGRVRGTGELPKARGNLDVTDLHYQAYGLKGLSTLFAVDLGPGAETDISLKADDLFLNGVAIASLSFGVKGSMNEHLVDLKVDADKGDLKLNASGGYDMKSREWKGKISGLDLDSRKLGRWKLASAVPALFSKDRARLKGLCLENKPASLCASIDWLSSGNGTAAVILKGFPVDELEGLIPSDGLDLNGALNAEVELGLYENGLSSGQGRVDIRGGSARYLVEGKQDIFIPFDKAAAEFLLKETSSRLRLDLVAGPDSLTGSFTLPGLNSIDSLASAPLSGRLKLDFSRPQIFSGLVQDVSIKKGAARAMLEVGGSFSEPMLKGRAEMEADGVEAPIAGITVDRTEITLESDGSGPLQIGGMLRSDNSTMVVAGNIIPDGSKGWPADIEVRGKDFRVLNVPDAKVFISPDINLSSANGTVRTRGVITVPCADITPVTIPAGVKTRNSDIVIVDSDEAVNGTESAPVDIYSDLTLKLLDRVHFNGFGLDCHITGEITLHQEPGTPLKATGDLRIVDGTLHALGRDLELQKGSISYAGGDIENPVVNLLATRDIKGVAVGILVSGNLRSPSFTGYSTEQGISSQDAITMLLTGKTRDDPGFADAASHSAAIAGADLLAGQIGRYVGVDDLSVMSAGKDSDETRVYAGRDITKDLTLGVETGTDEDGTQVVAKYRLWKNFNVEVKSGADRSGISLLYIIDVK